MRELAERVVSRVRALCETKVGVARRGPKGGRHDVDIVDAIAEEIASQVDPLARAGLDRDDFASLPHPSGRKQRVVAVVGADIDEHHARLQEAMQEREFVGLKRATNIEAKAIVVAERHIHHRAIVPGQQQWHPRITLLGGLPQGTPTARHPEALVVVLAGEAPARTRTQVGHARSQESGIKRGDRRSPGNQPTPYIVEVVAHAR